MRWEKAADLVRLARLLAGSAEGLTLDEMAMELGVSRRTAERMRDGVSLIFGALEERDDGRMRRFRLAGGLDRFLTAPTAVEMAELKHAAKLIGMNAPDRAAHLRSLYEKIATRLRSHERFRLETDVEALMRAEALARQVGPRPRIEETLLSALRDALLRERAVRFSYGGETSNRRRHTVVPYGLLFGQHAYLVGASIKKTKPVLWRLDRVSAMELTDQVARPPEDFDLDAFANISFGTYQEEPVDIVLRFSPEAAPDAKTFVFHPTQSVTDDLDGSTVVRFRAGGLLEIVNHLFTWGSTVTVIAPAELRQMMCDRLRTALDHHREC